MKAKIFILIGVPMSGKSTWVRENYPNTKVISRDDIVLEVHGSNDYNKAFNEVNQKEVNRILDERLLDASKSNEDVIIDMTNMTSKRRRSTLKYFTDFYKEAVVFPVLSNEEYDRRNKIRTVNENKSIPLAVLRTMLNSYQSPTKEEGFDKITVLK
jgi:predicted kinase